MKLIIKFRTAYAPSKTPSSLQKISCSERWIDIQIWDTLMGVLDSTPKSQQEGSISGHQGTVEGKCTT